MGMKQKMVGNVEEDSRIIILDESDYSIVSNTLVSAGEYEIDNIPDTNTKIILARNSSGEVTGYGGVTPHQYQAGPDIPFTDPFDGSDGAQPNSEYWTRDAYATSYAKLNGAGDWYYFINTGPGWIVPAHLTFNYQLSGDVDLEIAEHSSGSASTSNCPKNAYQCTNLQLVAENGEYWTCGMIKTSTGRIHFRTTYRVGDVEQSYVSEARLSTSYPDPTYWRLQRVGTEMRASWRNSESGWNWQGSAYTVIGPASTGNLTPRILAQKGINNGQWYAYVHSFTINQGTVV